MWQYLLHRIFGITPEAADQVKLGGGVVAFTAGVAIAFFAVVGGVSWALSASPGYALGIAAISAAVAVYFLTGTWRFADKHPDQAALGGASWLKLREFQFAAKGAPQLPSSPPISDPAQPLLPPPLPDDAPDAE